MELARAADDATKRASGQHRLAVNVTAAILGFAEYSSMA
jgi:hypothetical protein